MDVDYIELEHPYIIRLPGLWVMIEAEDAGNYFYILQQLYAEDLGLA